MQAYAVCASVYLHHPPINFWMAEKNLYEIPYTYCHVYSWLKTGFGLAIGFIDHLQVVTTNKYNTVTDFHTTKHFTLIPSVYLH
jgi:hypothetical protein